MSSGYHPSQTAFLVTVPTVESHLDGDGLEMVMMI